jgi:hypothetical protein
MTTNFANEINYTNIEKEEYYATKKLSGFSAACIGASFVINLAIIAYALISTLAA